MFSTEFQILIECCKIRLLQAPEKKLIQLLSNNQINWVRLQQMAAFHTIRPVVYDALKTLDSSIIDADSLAQLSNFVKIRSVHTIFLSQELRRIEDLFSKNNINAIAFKGVTWNNLFYKRSFREGADIDFLIEKKDVFRAFHLLIEDGYLVKTDDAHEYQPPELIKALYEFGQIEVTLSKKNIYNATIALDFHWDLLIQAQNYHFSVDELFANHLNKYEKLLLIIIIHNGKREAWTKLKYICDLLLFVHLYGQEIDWDAFIAKTEKYNLKKCLLMGLSLVNIFLPVKDTIHFSTPLEAPPELNIKFWEKASYYEFNVPARISFVRLIFKYHESISESFYYCINYIRYLSYPNPREKRLFTFPKERTLLNLGSKVLSYFYFNSFIKK
ncbi:nucleotidyltransferase family protein [Emticicia sp. 17c]|uniref:nucleotidyltransferase family protein n=1 Tax=Emticicia sp. 17c TaxID=3127704 RepID=UPI00301E090C